MLKRVLFLLGFGWLLGTTAAATEPAGIHLIHGVTTAGAQPDGNSVDIDTESSKLAENGLTYESLVSVERGRIEILKSAMGGGA